MKYLILAMALVAAGCAASPEAQQRKAHDTFERQERVLAFAEHTEWCDARGGYIYIERRGHSTRRDEIMEIPGRDDRVACVVEE